ncbi:MAG: methylated-DNA--[protein]-cysteine S-methyltransferase [Acidobacteriota bacterium]|nr:methylated-DNA--[protein]-cysteine S-methyltransferase [Acidobacteriota bacterium]
MRCKSVLLRVDALRTGELPERERQNMHEHFATCDSCSASLHDVRALASRMKSMLAPKSTSIGDAYDRIDDVWVAYTKEGLRLIQRGGTFDDFRSAYAARYGRPLQQAPIPDALRKQVVAAMQGEGVDKPRVDWSGKRPLEREVLALLSKIPRGEVRTYEWIARHVGRPRAVRAVGTILAKNSVPLVVPCHRVVPTAGGVGNYAFGSAMKRDLLQREGVDVDALEKLAKQHVRYIGSRTTKIACMPTCKDAKRIREENRVAFHDAREAGEAGFRGCMRCEPF